MVRKRYTAAWITAVLHQVGCLTRVGELRRERDVKVNCWQHITTIMCAWFDELVISANCRIRSTPSQWCLSTLEAVLCPHQAASSALRGGRESAHKS